MELFDKSQSVISPTNNPNIDGDDERKKLSNQLWGQIGDDVRSGLSISRMKSIQGTIDNLVDYKLKESAATVQAKTERAEETGIVSPIKKEGLSEGIAMDFTEKDDLLTVPDPIKIEPRIRVDEPPEPPVQKGKIPSVEAERTAIERAQPFIAGDDWQSTYEAYNRLEELEGASGDKTGAAKTGKLGMTEERLKIIDEELIKGGYKPEDYTSEQKSGYYLNQLNDKASRLMPGYDQLDPKAKSAMLQMFYNYEGAITKWPEFAKSVETGDYEGMAYNILDTARIDGKYSKGIAKARSVVANEFLKLHYGEDLDAYNENRVFAVTQVPGQGINYHKKDWSVWFNYNPKAGPHKSSWPGIRLIEDFE